MTMKSDWYWKWKASEALPERARVALRGLFMDRFQQHWGAAEGSTDIASSFTVLEGILLENPGSMGRTAYLLISAVVEALKPDRSATKWAQSILKLADDERDQLRALERRLQNLPVSTRANQDSLLAMEYFAEARLRDDLRERFRDILDLCLNGQAILPGSRGQRQLWNWLLTEAIPWAVNPSGDIPYFFLEGDGHPSSPAAPGSFDAVLGRMNWLQAAKNVYTDFHGDWYPDRWTWPELALLATQENLPSTIATFDAAPIWSVPIRVPKTGGGYRPAVLLSPRDRLIYQVLVDGLIGVTSAGLQSWAYGWRPEPSAEENNARYSRRDRQWDSYISTVIAGLTRHGRALHIDIHQYFASLPVAGLLSKLESLSPPGTGQTIKALGQFLASWRSSSTLDGVPQRCLGSSVLADFYLRDLDRRLSSLVESGALVTRWMDDIWVFSGDEQFLDQAHGEIRGWLAEDGLFENVEKSKICDAHEVAAILATVHIDPTSLDTAAVEGSLSRIVEDPPAASRTLIRYVCKEIKDQQRYSLLADLVPPLWQLQHGADHLARAISDWPSRDTLVEWYREHVSDRSLLVEWALGNFATMFGGAGESLLEDLTCVVRDASRGVALRALAASALTDFTLLGRRDDLVDVGMSTTEGLIARSLALCLAQQGETDAAVQILQGFEELQVLEELVRDPYSHWWVEDEDGFGGDSSY
jgi:hypothetical protein